MSFKKDLFQIKTLCKQFSHGYCQVCLICLKDFQKYPVPFHVIFSSFIKLSQNFFIFLCFALIFKGSSVVQKQVLKPAKYLKWKIAREHSCQIFSQKAPSQMLGFEFASTVVFYKFRFIRNIWKITSMKKTFPSIVFLPSLQLTTKCQEVMRLRSFLVLWTLPKAILILRCFRT